MRRKLALKLPNGGSATPWVDAAPRASIFQKLSSNCGDDAHEQHLRRIRHIGRPVAEEAARARRCPGRRRSWPASAGRCRTRMPRCSGACTRGVFGSLTRRHSGARQSGFGAQQRGGRWRRARHLLLRRLDHAARVAEGNHVGILPAFAIGFIIANGDADRGAVCSEHRPSGAAGVETPIGTEGLGVGMARACQGSLPSARASAR